MSEPENIFEVGESVNVKYTGYVVHGVVVQSPELDEHGRERRGWTMIRQDYETPDSEGSRKDMGDYRDSPEDERPVFGAADEYIYRDGEREPRDPLEDLRLAMLTGISARTIARNR